MKHENVGISIMTQFRKVPNKNHGDLHTVIELKNLLKGLNSRFNKTEKRRKLEYRSFEMIQSN